MTQTTTDHCRLVLIPPEHLSGDALVGRLKDALAAGDVASVIFPAYDQADTTYQSHLEICVPVVQSYGAAAIVVDDTRALGRTSADGIHINGGAAVTRDAVEKAAGRYIVGAGGGETRHSALETGETRPDYIFFGRFGFDTRPGPHRRNIALAEWWSPMVEIPCIVMGGGSIDMLDAAAATGADFVSLSRAVFSDGVDAGEAVAAATTILETHNLNERV